MAGGADPELIAEWMEGADPHAPATGPQNTSKRRRFGGNAAHYGDPQQSYSEEEEGEEGDGDGAAGAAGFLSASGNFRDVAAAPAEGGRPIAARGAALASGRYVGEENENFKVVIRVRPPLQRELEGDKPFVNVVRVPREQHPRTITITEHLDTDDGRGGVYSSQTYTFDRVYDQESKQRDVYLHTARAAVQAVLSGYNATMIAYGQTGTGKTYTMEGFTEAEHRGIIPRATEDVFDFIQHATESSKFLVRASYLQIYNEVISDLLRIDRRNLPIREGKDRGVYVDRLSEWVVRSPQEIYGLMEQGGRERVTGNTRMSELSSRSHALFRIICEMKSDIEDEEGEVVQSFKIGKLNIVDLAGSEKVRQTGATGQRLEESKHINRSLSHLGNVIAALTSTSSRQHVPYRDSKLTRILEDSLGGNCKTTMIATISPALESYTESLSTLKYANRAKDIKNEAVVNEDLDQRALIRKYERELKELRAELLAVNQNFASKKELVDLEQRRRQSEQDKMAALNALRARSFEVMEEKKAKEQLEEKINELESGCLPGGHHSTDADGVAFRDAIHKVSEEYMTRLDELDKERQVIEEDKAQVDRYKQLLLKQRDIMIALTARLNEHDGSILSQQEELDAYDQQQRLMEETLDEKTKQIIRLQGGRGCGHCCGPSSSSQFHSQIGTAGPADPSFVLSELKRAYSGGQERWLRENVRSEEGQDPCEEHYLTNDEKIEELYGLVISLRQELEMQPPNIRQRLLDAQEEKTSMEYLLSERVNTMVQAEIAERVSAYKREIDQWRSSHQLAEERLRNAEYTIELSKLSRDGQQPPDFQIQRVKEYIAKEVSVLKSQCEERVAELRRELDAREAERRQTVKDAERLHFELYSVKRRFNLATDGPTIPEFDRMWDRVQQHKDDARGPGQESNGRHPFSDVSNLPAGKTAASVGSDVPAHARERIKNLEARCEALKWQHSQFRAEYTGQLDEKNAELRRVKDEVARLHAEGGGEAASAGAAEVTKLQRALATHTKDRRALKTIMESKIKTKVDNISVLLRGCYLPTAPGAQRQKLESEVAQLQNLVNASIQAI